MTKLKTVLLVAVLIVVAAAVAGLVGAGAAIALVKSSYNGPVNIDRRSELTVHSNELGESMTLRLHLPVEYAREPDRRFPVVWVLDGSSQGTDIHRATQTLSRIGAAEPSIVVEVPHSSSGRDDDFRPPAEAGVTWGGQADRFLRFLEIEAIPSVETGFRADTLRVLAGHSLGGLFALYALAERPQLFDAYFAFSPSVWVGGESIIPQLRSALQQPREGETFLYVSLGSQEGNEMATGFDTLRETLDAYAPPGLRWQMEVTAGADHGSNPILSYPVAASHYWRP
ncbi:MAG: alpha/beta hydrolase-fold protein [Gemmatimonadota bacterium]